jgi:hypothetical protein
LGAFDVAEAQPIAVPAARNAPGIDVGEADRTSTKLLGAQPLQLFCRCSSGRPLTSRVRELSSTQAGRSIEINPDR